MVPRTLREAGKVALLFSRRRLFPAQGISRGFWRVPANWSLLVVIYSANVCLLWGREHCQMSETLNAGQGDEAAPVGCVVVAGVCVRACSVVSDSSVTLWTVACQAPLAMGFFLARILKWLAISFSRRCL